MKTPQRKAVRVTFSLSWSLTPEQSREASDFHTNTMGGIELKCELKGWPKEHRLNISLEIGENGTQGALTTLKPFVVPLRTDGVIWYNLYWETKSRNDRKFVVAHMTVFPDIVNPNDPRSVAGFFGQLCKTLTLPAPVMILPEWEYEVRITDAQGPRWVSEGWWMAQLMPKLSAR